ncbi:MAG TPA: putative porin [Nitrospiria bacterium]|nr:putative porin [Nitrospiria bacterium]
MKRWIGSLVVAPWALLAATLAGAEERKPLDQLLVEKGVLTKEEAASVQGAKLAAWLDRITFGGDIRLRQEMVYRHNGADDRSRQRFRLRVGADLKIDTVVVGVRLASGTGEHVSANKSFDDLSAPTPLYIDRAFVRWQGDDTRWLTVTGGRMGNPFFSVYSSDLVWDDDYNPEGLAENLSFALGGGDVFVNLAQIVLDEDSAGSLSTDQWLFGQQVGVKMNPTTTLQTALAVTYLNAVNTQNGTLDQSVCADGNSRQATGTLCPGSTTRNAELVNDYDVVHVTAAATTKLASLPVSVMGDAVKNTADTQDASGNDTKDGGYQVGVILGKAGDPRTWEVAYFYKKVGTDATLADIADSDFGTDGGTDRKGHIMWAAYNPTQAIQVKSKYMTSEVEDDSSAEQKDVSRLQIELSVKF